MAERIFIVDGKDPAFDPSAARRQFSLSLAVGFAVLAWAANVEFQPVHSASASVPAPRTTTAPAPHIHSQVVQYALATPSVQRN